MLFTSKSWGLMVMLETGCRTSKTLHVQSPDAVIRTSASVGHQAAVYTLRVRMKHAGAVNPLS